MVGASSPQGSALGTSTARLELPAGWTAVGNGSLGTIPARGSADTTFTVTPPAGASAETRVRLKAFVEAAGGDGRGIRIVLDPDDVASRLGELELMAEASACAPDLEDAPRRPGHRREEVLVEAVEVGLRLRLGKHAGQYPSHFRSVDD